MEQAFMLGHLNLVFIMTTANKDSKCVYFINIFTTLENSNTAFEAYNFSKEFVASRSKKCFNLCQHVFGIHF